jgi:hypothetical protein
MWNENMWITKCEKNMWISSTVCECFFKVKVIFEWTANNPLTVLIISAS